MLQKERGSSANWTLTNMDRKTLNKSENWRTKNIMYEKIYYTCICICKQRSACLCRRVIKKETCFRKNREEMSKPTVLLLMRELFTCISLLYPYCLGAEDTNNYINNECFTKGELKS